MCGKPWMNSEKKLIKAGVKPKGRTMRACFMFCSRHGIPFPTKDDRRDKSWEHCSYGKKRKK